MELIHILRNSAVVVISVFLLVADAAYIIYLSRDRNKWKYTANCYRVLSEKYKNKYEVNFVDESFTNSNRYKVINQYNEKTVI